jgi:hypothetical protein
MQPIIVSASALLDARPEDVYNAIADYHHGHPHILPKESLYDLRVEQGGYGEGTIIRFKAKALGVEQAYYQRVREPEPGRVLVEEDIDSPHNSATTFRVTPVEGGQKAQVEISTQRDPSPGLSGVFERFLIARILPPIYQKELKLLEAFAQRQHVSR